MFTRRGPILIAVSLLLALGAAWLANRWLISQTAPHAGGPNTVPVVVAAMDIPFGTTVETRHVTVIPMLKDTAPPDAFNEARKVEGKVARASMLKGEILLTERFTAEGEGSTLAAVVAKDMRAVSVRVDDVVGVGGFLLPGNYVDVVSAYREGSGTFSETVVQNVKVLAVDQTAASDKNEPVVVRAVTLEVTPQDAEKLVLAKQRGAIQLALRNPMDSKVAEKVVLAAATPAPAAAPAAAPVKAAAPAPKAKKAPPRPTTGVTVIRGTEVEREVPQSGN
jgi:pilus assembly protein CpaB